MAYYCIYNEQMCVGCGGCESCKMEDCCPVCKEEGGTLLWNFAIEKLVGCTNCVGEWEG